MDGTGWSPRYGLRASTKAVAENKRSEWRKMIARLREAASRAKSLSVRAAATSKAGEKSSQARCLLTEIA